MYGRRVVITGMGAVSSVGNSVDAMWNSLVYGKCGIDRITRFDPDGLKTQIAGEVKDLDLSSIGSEKELRKQDLFCVYAAAAFHEAALNAGLPLNFSDEGSPINPEMAGVCIGCGIGGLQTLETQSKTLLEKGPGRVSPFLIPMMISDMASGAVSIQCGAQGPNFAVVSACASGCHAIGESFHAIARGDADLMVTGGTESTLTPLCFAGFCAMKALSRRNDDPKTASRPFDRERDGFVMAEGAGILILEEYEHAKKRGAEIYAEILGYSATGDAYHITSPAPEGQGGARAFRNALRNAELNFDQVDYVNAHGTSTHLNDMYETQALKNVFGDHARKMAISSTKGTMGHSLGAAGGLETIVCCKTIQTGIIPPTINYMNPDPECDLDYTPNEARERKVDVAINTNLGFGGHNGVIVLRRCQ